MTNNESKGPFEGLLVIDMTHVLNGPFGTQLLCNMGARVIKVERRVMVMIPAHLVPMWMDSHSITVLLIMAKRVWFLI